MPMSTSYRMPIFRHWWTIPETQVPSEIPDCKDCPIQVKALGDGVSKHSCVSRTTYNESKIHDAGYASRLKVVFLPLVHGEDVSKGSRTALRNFETGSMTRTLNT